MLMVIALVLVWSILDWNDLQAVGRYGSGCPRVLIAFGDRFGYVDFDPIWNSGHTFWGGSFGTFCRCGVYR